LSERKNKEKDQNYAEVLKGRDLGQQESKRNEHIRDVYSKIPSTFRKQTISNHDEGNNRRKRL
jgi:hypothetical protein